MDNRRSLEILFERGRFELRVDGKEVQHVTSLSLDLAAGGIPKAVIEVIAIDGYVKLEETDVEIRPKVIKR